MYIDEAAQIVENPLIKVEIAGDASAAGARDGLTGTLSMSFQHFSTIFLSTTAGCWGCGGCWCGWNASFISPIKPAPLRGYPAMSSALGGGRAAGLQGVNHGLLRTQVSPTRPAPWLPGTYRGRFHMQIQPERNKNRCEDGRASLANQLHPKRNGFQRASVAERGLRSGATCWRPAGGQLALCQ